MIYVWWSTMIQTSLTQWWLAIATLIYWRVLVTLNIPYTSLRIFHRPKKNKSTPYLSIYLSTYLSIYLSFYLYIYTYICIYTYLVFIYIYSMFITYIYIYVYIPHMSPIPGDLPGIWAPRGRWLRWRVTARCGAAPGSGGKRRRWRSDVATAGL